MCIRDRVAVILEKGAALDEALLLKVVGHAGEAVAALHGKGVLLRVRGIDGADEMLVHRRIHARRQPKDDEQGRKHNQYGPEDIPQPAVPVKAVFALVAQGFMVVFPVGVALS